MKELVLSPPPQVKVQPFQLDQTTPIHSMDPSALDAMKFEGFQRSHARYGRNINDLGGIKALLNAETTQARHSIRDQLQQSGVDEATIQDGSDAEVRHFGQRRKAKSLI